MVNLDERVLIIGGAGFLGSYLVSEFLSNYRISILEKTGCNLIRIEKYLDNIELQYVDNLDFSQFFKKNNFDFIINCSILYGLNETLSDLIINNVVMPIRVIEACSNKTKAFINTDTFFNKPENLHYSYLQNYILTKKHLEECLEGIENDNRIVNMKLEHLYGPGDNLNKFIPSLINRLIDNEVEIAMTSGEQVRDYIYVKDAANAFAVILKNIDKVNKGFTQISVGTGKGCSIRELTSLMKAITGSTSKIKYGSLPYRENEIMHSTGNPKMLKGFGWEVNYDLDRGIKETFLYENARQGSD